jgi:HAD superfamily hydrolase (TIGR01509 family)
MIDAVVFDLDGVLIQSEDLWAEVRKAFVHEQGGRWHEGAARAMMGMSSTEWSRYPSEELGVPLSPERISQQVVERMEARYSEGLPLIPGARGAVQRLARRWPLALASSANRPLIDLVLDAAGVGTLFAATVSSEEVVRGKPAPDVYLEAARRLGIEPQRCAAVEDSTNGIRSAKAAGMRVVAIPNHSYPPDPSALAEADVAIASLAELTFEVLDPEALGGDGSG